MRFIAAHAERVTVGGLRWGVEPICRVLAEQGTPIAPSTYHLTTLGGTDHSVSIKAAGRRSGHSEGWARRKGRVREPLVRGYPCRSSVCTGQDP